MILDDKRIALRIGQRPEFLLRLDDVVRRYGHLDDPGLIVQARAAPIAGLVTIEVDDSELQARFLAGSGGTDAWWGGFKSAVGATPTFHGIASLPDRTTPSWICEMHRDGHFIAGLWRFPELPGREGKAVRVVADFHATYFDDFFHVVASAMDAQHRALRFETTATLVHADLLSFAAKSHFGNHVVTGDRVAVENLQWPVSTCELGSPTWLDQPAIMRRALAGAFGVKL